jgi:hypothetical protein
VWELLLYFAWQLSLHSNHHFQTMSTMSVFKFKTAKTVVYCNDLTTHIFSPYHKVDQGAPTSEPRRCKPHVAPLHHYHL